MTTLRERRRAWQNTSVRGSQFTCVTISSGTGCLQSVTQQIFPTSRESFKAGDKALGYCFMLFKHFSSFYTIPDSRTSKDSDRKVLGLNIFPKYETVSNSLFSVHSWSFQQYIVSSLNMAGRHKSLFNDKVYKILDSDFLICLITVSQHQGLSTNPVSRCKYVLLHLVTLNL